MFSSSVIRQKGESQNGCFKKAKHAEISKKQTFLPPDTHTCVLYIKRFSHENDADMTRQIVYLDYP